MNFIRLNKNNLGVENVSAHLLTRKYNTPFYCYSLSQLKNNFNIFRNAFKSTKPLICFSLKSNSNITLLRELKKMGSGADVVSVGELLKATKAGINAKKIVFSGVGKTEEEIVMAIRKKVLLINAESESEINLINKIAAKLVNYAEKKNKKLNELSFDEVKRIRNDLKRDVMKIFDVTNSVNSKTSYGGTSTKNIKKMISKLKKEIK